MSDYQVSALTARDAREAAALLGRLSALGEILYKPVDGSDFERLFLAPGMRGFAARRDGRLIGWAHGAEKLRFLGGETRESTPAYLTLVLVEPESRRAGVGTALLDALRRAYADEGKTAMVCSDQNPAHMTWLIPGTPGHDHNNAPGVDEDGMGYPFLLKRGFADRYHEVAMYMALKDYRWSPELDDKRRALLAQGIRTGAYDLSLGDEYDEMCTRVGSEYWRNVLRTELAAWRENRPNDDPDLWPDGVKPKGPRTLLTATTGGHIVGFTGPVDLQRSGRGWFTGICTDPDYGGRGIASVLFNLLMQAFVDEGAAFCTLFTGRENHAQKIYARAGLRVAARWAVMSAPLSQTKGQGEH